MPSHSKVFGEVFDQQQQTSKFPATTTLQHKQQHDRLIKEANQRLDASMDVIFNVLKCSGVSKATIHEMRQNVTKQKHQQVLIQAQQYMVSFSKETGECFLLITGWEALSRLNDIRYKRALKVIRNIQLSGRGNLRRANVEMQQLAESCSASYLGLYKANAWKKRMEQKQEETSRSLSI